MWFQQRAGVITASKFKAVCHTDCAMPSESLILGICYPLKHRFSAVQTRYGCQHELSALSFFQTKLFPHHQSPKLVESGFFRCAKYPFLGASPDSIFTCDCHGQFVVEVKCPYLCKKKSQTPSELAVDEKDFCLEERDGIFNLKRNHSYYYQVQMQMVVCDVNSAFFVVWSEKESFIEMINIDNSFIERNLEIASKFFKLCILPELTAKWYSRRNQTAENKNLQSDVCCYCQQAKPGPTVDCQSSSCLIKTYHISCLHLDSKPQGKWFCPSCPSRRKKRKIVA